MTGISGIIKNLTGMIGDGQPCNQQAVHTGDGGPDGGCIYHIVTGNLRCGKQGLLHHDGFFTLSDHLLGDFGTVKIQE